MKTKRFKKGQTIYRICKMDNAITTEVVQSCGLKKLSLVCEYNHGHTTPYEIRGEYLTFHATIEEAQNELNK